MKASVVPYVERSVWARRHSNGDVELFQDEDCVKPVAFYAFWRSDCPSGANRYVNVEKESFRLRWKKGKQ